jgi:hypothetical protein
MPQDATFQRDLGYLAKFLDSLSLHAATLEPQAGERLLALLDEQTACWQEIGAILGGVAPAVDTIESAAPRNLRGPQALTVGSLLES